MKFKNFYKKFCKFSSRFDKLEELQDPPENLLKNINYSNLNVSGSEVVAGSFLGFIIGTIILFTVTPMMIYFNFSKVILILIMLLPFSFYIFIGWYPQWRKEKLKSKIIGQFPQLITYLSANLRSNPNLEIAVQRCSVENQYFGEALRKEFWMTYLSFNHNIDEALDNFSEKFSEVDDGVKRSIDLLKSSVKENNKENREIILEKAIKSSFQTVQEKIEEFSSNLKTPVTLIYGMGVLLPLVLLIVFPALNSIGFQLSAIDLGVIYCLILPAGMVFLKNKTLNKRPDTFFRSKIPLKYKKKRLYTICISIILISILLTFTLNISKEFKVLSVIWGTGISIATFNFLSSKKSLEIWQKNQKLEREFSESLLQLSNHLKKGVPPEKALQKTATLTEGGKMSKILMKSSKNIKTGGMTFKEALFDSSKGSLKDIHSKTIKNTFRILAEFISDNPVSGGKSIEKISEHLKEMSKIEKRTKNKLKELSSSMKSVTVFFAPLITSISVRIHQLLIEETSNLPFLNPETQISHPTFLAIIGVYIIILTTILTSYMVEIEHGKDRVIKRANLAKTLPTALTIFTFGYVLGGQIITAITI